jgi:hypothetical protein
VVAYRIFVSHVWKSQHELYWGLMKLLAGAKRFRVSDLSVPKIRPFDGEYQDARAEILAALLTADVVLVINTSAIDQSAAVKDELREASENRIPIIAISPPKRNGRKPQSSLPQVASAIKAHWTTDSIVGAIREARNADKRRKRATARKEQYVPIDEIDVVDLDAEALAEVAADDDAETFSPNSQRSPFQDISSPTPREVLTEAHCQPRTVPWWRRLFSSSSSGRPPSVPNKAEH